MKQILRSQKYILVPFLAVLFFFGTIAQAHDGENHDAVSHGTQSIEQMEKMIDLLEQLIVLLTTLKSIEPTSTVVVPVVASDDTDEMETHHEEHATGDTSLVEPEEDEIKLVIEIEPHNGQTHAHVRYVDKPEEMFFVTAGIEDEDGIVSAISAKTGLGENEVREALKYMQ